MSELGPWHAGAVVVDPAKREVTVQGRPVQTTGTEFELLAALLAARGRTLARRELIDVVWGAHVRLSARVIDVHVATVRKKLGTSGQLIETVRGVGYRIRIGLSNIRPSADVGKHGV